ncbi:YidC/Oxa1 family membrane protein insertase [Catenuloplanes nepalensis]|uniref:Membrane protein insertase YidC n=1 Tax=Catenuloplanes nepalensis TaxID=587533 RepID=A0ABT9N1P9_9ACTN|nr:YidC/Oxa1 family membrane protein insertase [Catenuloplanes nepalensis]MDP9797520.1 YidC/Oxa1 family membrane protein insertase [Catenuloplanes nepalensis]
MLAFNPIDGAAGIASTVVTSIASVTEPFTGTAATAIAIILFTMGVRLLISPLTWAQIRGQRRTAALAPKLRELQAKHRDDPAALQAEMLKMYREEGASPLGGCLPALLQVPFFTVMYRLFTTPTLAGEHNALLDERFFGTALGAHVNDGGLALFAVLLAMLTVLAWWSSRRMALVQAANPTPADAPPGQAQIMRVMRFLPYGTVLFALVVPLAAVLYLVTTTTWTAAERLLLGADRHLLSAAAPSSAGEPGRG